MKKITVYKIKRNIRKNVINDISICKDFTDNDYDTADIDLYKILKKEKEVFGNIFIK